MRGKVLSIAIGLALLGVLATRGDMEIVRLEKDGTLTWTNTVANAAYRIDASPYTPGGLRFTNVTQVSATNTVVSLSLSISSSPLLFRVVWLDPPIPRPVGDWIYSGFEDERLTVTGLVTFAQSGSSLTGSIVFKHVAAGADHPEGSGSFTNLANANTNAITIPLSTSDFHANNFVLSGQMAGDEFWGQWAISSSQAWAYSTSQGRWILTGGFGGTTSARRFSARRK